MKRYPMYDPPEYVGWTANRDVMEEFERTLKSDPERAAIIRTLDEGQLLALYEGMVRFRLHDITLRRWVKQGVISKAWLGTGEEAVTIGAVHALDRHSDIVGPMIRNAGACHEMGISVADMLRAYLATGDGLGGGKDFHIGDIHRGVVAPTTILGSTIPVFAGLALSFKQRGERRVALTWVGDGATKTTPAHEGLNLAAVLKLPAIYVFQNNQVAMGTRVEQHQSGPFEAYADAYGIAGLPCAGNNVLDVYAAVRIAADMARDGRGPILVFAETFRMGGHATHDDQEARFILSKSQFEHWGKRDPIGTYESHLQSLGIESAVLGEIEERILADTAAAEKEALDSRETRMPAPETAVQGVYAD